MNEIQQLIDLTEKGLTQVATQLGTTLPQLWEIMIMQQYVEAAQSFISLGLCLVVVLIIYKKRKSFRGSYFFDDNTPACLIGVGGLVIFFLYFAFTLLSVFKGIGQVINPEYYAIQSIIEQIGILTNK